MQPRIESLINQASWTPPGSKSPYSPRYSAQVSPSGPHTGQKRPFKPYQHEDFRYIQPTIYFIISNSRFALDIGIHHSLLPATQTIVTLGIVCHPIGDQLRPQQDLIQLFLYLFQQQPPQYPSRGPIPTLVSRSLASQVPSSNRHLRQLPSNPFQRQHPSNLRLLSSRISHLCPPLLRTQCQIMP
jgi:hypothetical protein